MNMATTKSDEIYGEVAHFIHNLNLSIEDFDALIEDLDFNRKNLTVDQDETDRIGKQDDEYDRMQEMEDEMKEEVAETEEE